MNEPVAHRFKWEEQEEWQYGDGYDATGAPNDPDYFAYEPLYTHPIDTIPYKDLHQVVKNVLAQPMRELTDEEILKFKDKVPYTLGSDLIDFARAILRKAQEK